MLGILGILPLLNEQIVCCIPFLKYLCIVPYDKVFTMLKICYIVVIAIPDIEYKHTQF